MRTLIIFPVMALLALIAGGIFVSSYWQTTVHTPSQPVEGEIKEEAEEEPVVEEEAETIKDQEFIEDAQVIITKAQALIAKAQGFIRKEKERKQLIELAQQRSSQIKGLYINEFIANYQTPVAVNSRQTIKNLLDETELNGVVIDVKEARGPYLPNSLKKLIEEFQQKDIWVIARICVFRDSSLQEAEPEWYLATSSEGYWLDPSNEKVRDYIIDFSKKVIDFGFDELQFDYVRFPSGHPSQEANYEVILEFFLRASQSLKSYKPSIILSVDLFGYVATHYQASNIGQRLKDAGETFDYISFMLYPSHFYSGFEVDEDLKRGLPSLSFSYEAEDISQVVSSHPYEVVLRSVLAAADYLALFGSQAKIRPWLQDFSLAVDTSRGIIYDAEKVRDQIMGAEDSGSSGWLLWNPVSIYTKEALREAPFD